MDCVEGMMKIPENSVDLIIADPPYNASKGNVWKWEGTVKIPGFGGPWSKIMEDWDSMTISEYFAFTTAWLSESKRILKPHWFNLDTRHVSQYRNRQFSNANSWHRNYK